MLIDIHIHESKYSHDSHVSLARVVQQAKSIGLDGVCITDHDSHQIQAEAKQLSQSSDFLIIVGAEVLTEKGDILVFGLEELPPAKLPAQQLIDLVNAEGGVAIAAHPFRDNGRGLGNKIKELQGLHGIEVLNGSTVVEANLQAYHLSQELNLAALGASDAHRASRIGKYVSHFETEIKDRQDFITAVKKQEVSPAIYHNNSFQKIEAPQSYPQAQLVQL
ncbi:PHP domain-containing protein [Fuchsiella alkaliacetigena]|uniref:PHP domain-containing protein n=1 Tax=Fuchsiella alkaliacetigena TaxID=957042 RepID=UPI00200B5416|nr:PHP domain-containing protein [Fuchsiella alkaliacetigena]MCK8825915.1 PHP domain-containing protein [Fuchsiella alkaliacetigena]